MTFGIGAVVLGVLVLLVLAGYLAWRPSPLSRVFAACLAGLLFVELGFFGMPYLVGPLWFCIHVPSRLVLGARWDVWPDPELGSGTEDDGTIVGTAMHLGDLCLWSALVTGVVWVCDTKKRRIGVEQGKLGGGCSS